MKEMKVEKVLSGYHVNDMRINNRPFKFKPEFVENENKVYQRARIFKNYDTFKNQVSNNYTQRYMSTLYGLLFKNEKKYYIRRNKLNINVCDSTEDNTDEHLPLTQVNRNEKTFAMPPIVIQTPEKSYSIQKTFEKTSFTPARSNFTLSHTHKIKNIKFRALSVEKDRLLDMIYTSNEFFKKKQATKQERLLRRINIHHEYPKTKSIECTDEYGPKIDVSSITNLLSHKFQNNKTICLLKINLKKAHCK